MKHLPHLPQSTLFLVRLWTTGNGDDDDVQAMAWRGRIQLMGAGWAATFEDWPALQLLLEGFLVSQREPGTDTTSCEADSDDKHFPE